MEAITRDDLQRQLCLLNGLIPWEETPVYELDYSNGGVKVIERQGHPRIHDLNARRGTKRDAYKLLRAMSHVASVIRSTRVSGGVYGQAPPPKSNTAQPQPF